MNKKYTLNSLLAGVLGAVLLAGIVLRTFVPKLILPELDVPAMVAISLIALLIEHYVAPGAPRCYICIPLFAAVTFFLLPIAACFASWITALKLAVQGALVFTAATWLFTSMTDRLSTGPAAKAAPVMSAIGLYLAAQGMLGMML